MIISTVDTGYDDIK